MSTPEPLPFRLLDEHDYAIVDQVLFPEWPSDWNLIPLIPHGLREESQARLLPALLPLQSLSPLQRRACFDQLETAHQQGGVLRLQALIKTSASPQSVQSHCSSMLILRGPQSLRALLRAYDPRVFIHLSWLLSPAQWTGLFGPVNEWSLYLPFGIKAWHTLERPALDSPRTPPPLSVGQALYDDLVGLQVANQTLATSPLVTVEALQEKARHLLRALRIAQAMGLQRNDEQQAFLQQTLRYGTGFVHHPDWRALFDSYDRSEQTYCDACAMLSEQDWQRFVAPPSPPQQA